MKKAEPMNPLMLCAKVAIVDDRDGQVIGSWLPVRDGWTARKLESAQAMNAREAYDRFRIQVLLPGLHHA